MDIFAEISEFDEGNVQRDADDALAEVIEAVRLHGKPGAVTITVLVAPAVRQGTIGVMLGGKIAVKKPERTPEGSFRYIRKDGSLSKTNPGQTPLPFNTVPNDTETRIVSAESTDVRSVN